MRISDPACLGRVAASSETRLELRIIDCVRGDQSEDQKTIARLAQNRPFLSLETPHTSLGRPRCHPHFCQASYGRAMKPAVVWA
jgi:hypothetical protein